MSSKPWPFPAWLLPPLLLLANDRGFLSYLTSSPGIDPATLLGTLRALATGLAFALALWGLGRAALRALPPRVHEGRAGEESAVPGLSFGIGLLLFSWYCFLLGLFGLLKPALALPPLVVGVVLAVLDRGALLEAARSLRTLPAPFAALSAWVLFNALIQALAPPTDFDSLAHHLPIAARFASGGSIASVPWMLNSYFPSGLELAAAASLFVGDERLPALLHLACGIAAAMALHSLARRRLGHSAWLATALFISLPVVDSYAGTAHNDLAVTLMAVLSLTVLEPTPLLAALLAGGAAGFKYTGLVWAVLLCALYPWSGVSRGRGAWIRFVVVAALAACPWYLKNWIETGNPLWPFHSGIFGDADGAAYVDQAVTAVTRWEVGPLAMIVNPGAPDSSAWILAPLALVLAAGGWLGVRKHGVVAALLLAGLFYVIVGRNAMGWRLALPAVPVLCLVAAAGAAELWEGRSGASRAVAAGLALAFLPVLGLSRNNGLFFVAGLRSRSNPSAAPREAYLSRSLDVYPALRWANAHLPGDSRVLLFREIRGFYLEREYRWGDPLNQALIRYDGLVARDVLPRLREAGITHVLVNEGLKMYRPHPSYYRPEWAAVVEAALRHGGTLLHRDGTVSIWKIVK